MIHPHQLLAIAGWGVILGVLLGSYFTASFLLIGSAFILASVYFLQRNIFTMVLLFLIFLTLGASRYIVAYSSLIKQNIPSGEYLIEGRVAGDVSVSGASQQFNFLVTRLEAREVEIKTHAQLWSRQKLSYGDRLQANVSIEPVTERYYLKDGVIAKMQIKDVTTVASPNHILPKRALYEFRDSIANKINSFLSTEVSSLVNGLLLGLRQDLSEDFKASLKNSGTTHIVALSGFNITIIIAFFLAIFKRLPKRFTYLLSAVTILAFVVMTGATSSVVRAGIMGGVFLLASIWGRPRHAGNALLLAVVAMILSNPFILQYDIGFQLSMMATLGLIYIPPHLKTKYSHYMLVEVLTSTLAASLATLPLLVFHFGGLSLISVVSNLVVVPLVPIVMLLGFIGLLLNLLGSFWMPLNYLIELPALLLIGTVNFFGNLPGAFVQLPPISSLWVALYYCIMLLLLTILYDRKKRSL